MQRRSPDCGYGRVASRASRGRASWPQPRPTCHTAKTFRVVRASPRRLRIAPRRARGLLEPSAAVRSAPNRRRAKQTRSHSEPAACPALSLKCCRRQGPDPTTTSSISLRRQSTAACQTRLRGGLQSCVILLQISWNQTAFAGIARGESSCRRGQELLAGQESRQLRDRVHPCARCKSLVLPTSNWVFFDTSFSFFRRSVLLFDAGFRPHLTFPKH
jgi:hypothetical protein